MVFVTAEQVALSIGEALIVLGSQYWGQKRTEPICRLTGIALRLEIICTIIIFAAVSIAPEPILHIFSNDPAIIAEGVKYLAIIKYTFVLFTITNIFMAALRCVETVNISFFISLASLMVNVAINYCLIYGKFGCPEMGIQGAAVGTLVARILELAIILLYIAYKDRKLQLFKNHFFKLDKNLRKDFRKVAVPVILSQILWAISVPMQTAILGHLECIDLLVGIVLGILLFLLRTPLLSYYNLSDTATELALQMIVILSFVMVGMSYQMPVSMGIIRGGGDARFVMIMNMISTWAIVMPLSFMSAFWWKWPVAAVVIVIQSDQAFKCLPTFIRMRSYKWIKKLTRKNA